MFNGDISDQRVIEVDRNGVYWRSVGTWATLQLAAGNPDPAGIDLWEVGNDVHGGRPQAGVSECESFGWEDVRTCDGKEYVTGTGEHDGFLDIQEAMLAVDSDISVGAVGVAGPESWNNWGNEVIDSAGKEMGFYALHQYSSSGPPDTGDVVRCSDQLWSPLIGSLDDVLHHSVPIAVTEYSLVSVQDADNERLMTQAANAFFIADTIGQLATAGVPIANQWNLANGTADNGTDYGLIDADTYEPAPQFHAIMAWARVGETLPAGFDPSADLRVYPTQHADDYLTVVAINIDDTPSIRTFEFVDAAGTEVQWDALIHASAAADLDATTMEVLPTAAAATGQTVQLPKRSISSIESVLP